MAIEEILQKRIEYYAGRIKDYSTKKDKAFWIRMDECRKILNELTQETIPDEIPPKKDKSYLPDIKMQPRGSELPLYKRMQFRVAELNSAREKIKRFKPDANNMKLIWKIDKLLELYEKIKDMTDKEIKNLIQDYKELRKQLLKPECRMVKIIIKMYLDELKDLYG